MNIGILGGTFNPIHNGHLHIAQAAEREIPLDRLIWIATAISPFKSKDKLLDAKLRYQMVRLAIEDHPNWQVSDLELDETHPSYTVDTLEKLAKQFPKPHRLYLIMGSDNLAEFPRWKDSSRILKLAEVAVLTRPGFSLRLAQGPVRLIPIPSVDVAASRIRDYLREGRSIKGMVPEKVREFIEKNELYLC